jgi:Papain family cysteine protease
MAILAKAAGDSGRLLASSKETEKPIHEMSWGDFNRTYIIENTGDKCRYSSKDFKPSTQNIEMPLPFEVDWVTMGAVPPVKNQGKCPASWVFSAVSAIEAHSSIVSGEPIRLFSNQQVLDCMGSSNRMNCSAGTPGKAYDFLQRQGGLALRYLYRDKPMTPQIISGFTVCKYDVTQSGVQVGSGSKDLKPYDENALIQALLTIGPITVLMDGRGLKDYRGGIWDGNYTDWSGNKVNCSNDQEDLNHVALLVAVEWDKSGKQYYTLQNSWGEEWGENGYFRLYRIPNICGISLCASYPRLMPY